jgi:uncharacterized membrane protein YfcA
MHRVLHRGDIAVIEDMNRDATAADVRCEVAAMEIGPVNAFLTRVALATLRMCAYSPARFRTAARRAPFVAVRSGRTFTPPVRTRPRSAGQVPSRSSCRRPSNSSSTMIAGEYRRCVPPRAIPSGHCQGPWLRRGILAAEWHHVVIVLAGIVVAFGALVQGTVGFGLALVAAPLLVLIDPAFVPVPLLLLATGHALLMLRRERGETDWTGVGWATLGRLPGIALGVLAVALLPERWFAAAVALTVLVCSGLSLLRWSPRPTAPALLVAGVVSGAGGTASAIGGPPVALLYQQERGPRVRATLGAYFAAGSLLSLLGLGLAGEVRVDALRSAAVLLPFMVAGFAVSTPARKLLDRGWTRPAVLAVAIGGALALLVTAAVG